MIIAHIPASYILTKKLQTKFKNKSYLYLGMLAGFFPDFDMLYFYFIDNQSTLHHKYWIHIPFYWALLFIAFFTISILSKRKRLRFMVIIFFANILLHLFLDTIVGKIDWLYPLSDHSFVFFDVPARYSWWVWNFVLHWTFLLEVGICLGAGYLFTKERRKTKR